jgi:hypothetical protein
MNAAMKRVRKFCVILLSDRAQASARVESALTVPHLNGSCVCCYRAKVKREAATVKNLTGLRRVLMLRDHSNEDAGDKES